MQLDQRASISKPAIDHYVGETGIQSTDDLLKSASIGQALNFGPDDTHNLMFGMLVSPATLEGGDPTNTDMPWRHVRSYADLSELLGATDQHGAIGMIHIELHKDWPGNNEDPRHVIMLLNQLHKDGLGPAVQLNGILTPDAIRQIAEETGAPIVLQLREELTERGVPEVLNYIEKVEKALSKVLVDLSGGAGRASTRSRPLSGSTPSHQIFQLCFLLDTRVVSAGRIQIRKQIPPGQLKRLRTSSEQ